MTRLVLVCVALELLAGAYWLGAERHLWVVNVDPSRHDQSAYLDYARNMAESRWEFVGGRNRMPAFPFLLSLLWAEDLDTKEFFIRGKYLNLVLSLLALPVVWWTARRALPAPDAVLLTLITAFTVFVYKAAYTQCEILYYTLVFVVFASMLRLLRRPSWTWSFLTGVTAGLAYLTKAAIPPLLALFAAWGLVAAATNGGRLSPTSPSVTSRGRVAAKRMGGIVVLLAAFLVTVFPYIATNRQQFGHWFYNVNSTFYIWYDSWEEAIAGVGAHGATERWPDLPPEQLPSARRYLREHTARQIVEREMAGLRQLHRNLSAPISYGSYTKSFGDGRYLRLYGTICLALVLLRPRTAWRVLTGEGRWLVAGFGLTSFVSSILL